MDETELETIPRQYITNDDVVPLPAEVSSPNPRPAEPHPSAEQVDRLFALAEQCREPKELLGRRLREIMGLPGESRITKRRLREYMTPTQFEVALAYYQQLLKRQIEEDVPDGTPPAHVDADASLAAPASTEDMPVPFVPSSSAPGPDGDPAREKLRSEALGWGIAEQEIEHIVTHHPLAAARNILWRALRGQADTTLAISG